MADSGLSSALDELFSPFSRGAVPGLLVDLAHQGKMPYSLHRMPVPYPL